MACAVKGYEDSVEREQQSRNLVYLDQPEIVLGERLNNITPHLLAVLTAIQSPFYLGGPFDYPHVAQFLWALHVDYSPDDRRGRKRMLKAASRFALEQCREELGAFIDLTFMDMPRGGDNEKPIAASVAWLVYRFRHDPWHMSEAETLAMPLRKLYQELRCWTREQGKHVGNKSDEKTRDWLAQVQAALDNGEITQEQLDAFNARARN